MTQSVSRENGRSSRMEICIVEDDADLREELTSALQHRGHRVRSFPGSRELYAALLECPCNIVILDIGLPGEDGYSIARRIYALGSMGIIVLTARGGTEDRVRALCSGANYYLTKPVVMDELISAIKGIGHRLPHRLTPQPASVQAPTWRLAPDGWTLFDPSGTALPLTAQERAFMACLWQCRGNPVSRDDLAVAMSDDPFEYDFHRFDTLVSRLRQKAENLGLMLPIRTVRGRGYLFAV